MKLAAAILFAACSCFGATSYYVDYVGGSDAAAGTSSGTAWQHCPGDSAATDSAAAATLVAGDSVIFKGGVWYYFGTNSSGISMVNGVTYDGNSAGSWGTGKAVLTDSNAVPGKTAMSAASVASNLVVQDFVFTQIGGSASLPPDLGSPVAPNGGGGVVLSHGQTNIVVRDCDFSMLGYWFNQKPMNAAAISGVGVQCYGASDLITISNCTFRRMMIGVNLSAGGNLTRATVANCEFTDSLVWCVDIAVVTTGVYNDYISVHDCVFHDYHQFNSAYWTGYGEWPHVDGIFFRADYDFASYGSHNYFYNNLFYDAMGAGGGTANIYVTEGESVSIYNNVFIHSGMANGNVSIGNGPLTGASDQFVNIFNNTFYDSYAVGVGIGCSDPTRPPSHINAQNNLFYDAMTGSGNNFVLTLNSGNWVLGQVITNWFFDHNLYKSFNIDGTWANYPGLGGEMSFTSNNFGQSFRAFGWETNGLATDPLFVDITPGLTQPLSVDLRLQTNSPAIGAGTNLSALNLPGLATDRLGVSRPPTGPWTMGAYAPSVATNAVPPTITLNPTSQSVIVGQTASFFSAASGTSPLRYHWYHDGTNLNTLYSVYILSPVSFGDAGNYSVIVTNLYGSATSSVAVLTVVLPPTNTVLHVGTLIIQP